MIDRLGIGLLVIATVCTAARAQTGARTGMHAPGDPAVPPVRQGLRGDAAIEPPTRPRPRGDAAVGTDGAEPALGLAYPFGVETFETLAADASVAALEGWGVEHVGSESAFVACGARDEVLRCLRIADANPAAVRNRVTSPALVAPEPRGYRWTLRVRLESPPPIGAERLPAFAIEHAGEGGGFAELFGIELTPRGGQLFVADLGGGPRTAALFELGSEVRVGDWIDLELELSLVERRVAAAANGGARVDLPVALAPVLDARTSRFAYRGSGAGNVMQLELDEVGVAFLRPLDPLRNEIDFEGFANGQALVGDELDERFTVRASGANLGPAIFDSTVGGPNAQSQDPDLLVDRGNVLILQSDTSPAQTAPGVFDRPNDDADGGTITFDFTVRVRIVSLDLIDMCPQPQQTATVTLVDANGSERTYTVPSGYTNDVAEQGPPGVLPLSLFTLEPQAGANATATVLQDESFDPAAVVQLRVRLGGSGAIDDLVFLETPRCLYPMRQFLPVPWGQVAVADLDGDRIPDVASPNYFQSSLHLLFNRGDGTFPDATDISTPSHSPNWVVAADLTGDGIPDLASANRLFPFRLVIRRNRGDGVFDEPYSYPLDGSSEHVAAGDLGGDGDVDLVVSPSGRVFGNQGDGTFTAVDTVGPCDRAVIADLDGDGLDDVATTSSVFSVWRGLAGGALDGPVDYPAEREPFALSMADLDGDGDLDAAIGNGSAAFTMLVNAGDGTFGAPVSIPLRQASRGTIATDDLDGDGRVDVAVGHVRDVSLLFNQGGGGFDVEHHTYVGNVSSLDVADLDGDGLPDLLVGPTTVLNLGRGEFDFPDQSSVSDEFLEEQVAADFDGDGDDDVAVTTSGLSRVAIVLNRDGVLGFDSSYRVGNFSRALSSSDLNGDGAPDLMAAANDSGWQSVGVLINRNAGDGRFFEQRRYTMGGGVVDVEPADLDGDGAPDLVASVERNEIRILVNRGDGTFSFGPTYQVVEVRQVALADLDGDGDQDIAATSGYNPPNGSVRIWLNDGDGTFQQGPTTAGLPGNGSVTAADVNGDGLADLIVGGGPAGRASLGTFVNRGDATFVLDAHFELPLRAPVAMRLVDVAGDARPDIVVADDDNLLLLIGTADGRFDLHEYHTTDGANGLAILDVDEDGLKDITVSSWGPLVLLRCR